MVVGRGMLDAACPGDVFSAPPVDYVYETTKLLRSAKGVLYIVNNYTGDRLAFEMAREMAEADGIRAETLIVVPDGPLLGIPFGMLLTGAAEAGNLGAAPWLIRRHAIEHVPSAQTLVTLRNAGAGSTAPLPWVGFGDFVPPSAQQLLRSFPVDRCAAASAPGSA